MQTQASVKIRTELQTQANTGAPEAPASNAAGETVTPITPEWKGPLDYSALSEPRKFGPFLETTRSQRNRILEYNKTMNDGLYRSDIDGSVGDKPIKVPKGAKANMKQVEVDHIEERVNGGSNSNNNQRVVLKQQNHDKEMQRRKKS